MVQCKKDDWIGRLSKREYLREKIDQLNDKTRTNRLTIFGKGKKERLWRKRKK